MMHPLDVSATGLRGLPHHAAPDFFVPLRHETPRGHAPDQQIEWEPLRREA